MPNSRSPLRDDPAFIEDCLNLRKSVVMEKWGVSSGLVVNVKRDNGGKLDMARTKGALPEAGESDQISDGPDGRRFDFVRNRPVTLEDARRLIRSSGDDPDLYHISIRTIAYGGDKSSNKISAWPKQGLALAEAAPLSHLYAEAAKMREQSRKTAAPVDPSRATIVAVADLQLGKVGRRGGTPETLARIESKLEKLAIDFAERAPSHILIADLGDGIEGFESGGNPMFTNDLSLPDQIDAYSTEIFKFVRLASAFAPSISVAVVPSNHSAWRRAKQTLGRPSDDFGILVHKQVKKVADAAGINASWHSPIDFDESVRVDVLGVPIGLVHGNQFGPGQAVSWWEKQAFGSQAITHCDVLLHGHYHCFSANTAGTNPATGRERIGIGAPTLVNGSDWFRQVSGRDSEPGLLIFDVTPDGFDLGSLKIL